MFKNNPQLSAAMLAAFKTALDGGFIHIFSGPEPAGVNDPLDLVGTHTRLCVLSLAGGATGLTLLAPNGGTISKPAGDTWSGAIAFEGADAGGGPLEPTFFRFCQDGDNGSGAGTGPRMQGSAGGPASAADMKLGNDTLTDDGVSTASVVIFNYRIGFMG